MNNIVEMRVSTPRQFIDAIRLSQNAFLRKAVISVQNSGSSFAEPSQLVHEIQYGISRMYSNLGGHFANAQISGYSFGMTVDPFGRYCLTNLKVQYFNNEKELNDLICVTAEIAELLNKKVRDSENEFEKVKVFDRWVRTNFEYKDNSRIGDHKAIELLKSRGGVCQAIAATAVLVLSYMGVKVLYVSGEGKGSNGWGAHAWNAVKINDKWIHVDFTFSINSVHLPNTKSVLEYKAFRATHLWDLKEYGVKSLNSKWGNAYSSRKCKLLLSENDSECLIDGVNVVFEKPLMVFRNDKTKIDLIGLIRILGGGVELMPATGLLNICINNKRISIKNGFSLFGDGYFDISVLDAFCKSYWNDESNLVIIL